MPPFITRRQPARAVLLAAVSLLLTLDALGVGGRASAERAIPAAQLDRQSVAVSVLPPIRQRGKVVARRSLAETTVVVTVTPAVRGRDVALEQRSGGRWRPVGSERINARGQATFFVPGWRAGTAEFRASAGSFRGYPEASSLSTAGDWGKPDFVDEFSGDTLGSAWSHRIQFHNPWGGRACSKGDPSTVEVQDGSLRLTSAIDPMATELCPVADANGQPLGSYPYRLNANISTQYSADFLYGVAAARMRFPRSLGQHASFWLQPRGLLDTRTTPWGAEVDVVEYYGERGRRSLMASAVHAPLPSGDKRQIGGMIPRVDKFLTTRSDRWWSNFHVFSIEWTPTEYIFRISGHEVWRTDQGVSDVPEFLILSMLSSDYELPTIGAETVSRTAEVDWVAFWRAD